MSGIVQDVRYALRALRKSPGFTAVAVLTLALGIGANTAIFSVMDAALFKPLPYGRPERLIRIWQSEPKIGGGRLGAAPPEFAAYRDRSRVFATVAGYQRTTFDLTGTAIPEQISAWRASAALFPTLGVAPLIGRTFTAEEERPASAKVAILSHRFWRTRYAGDPAVVERHIRLNEEPYQIIGVMPEGFSFPFTNASPGDPPALWVPLSFTDRQLGDWASSFDTSMVARLRDGVTLSSAQEDVQRVAADFQREHPNIYSGNLILEAAVDPWTHSFSDRLPMVLTMLGAAVGCVLLIACANVSNLLLARAGARQRELSIRRALGASPARLMRQIVAEGAVLAIAGAVLGCGVAMGLVRAAAGIWTAELNIASAAIDGRVLLFTIVLSAVTSLICSVAPAWTMRRPEGHDSLRESARLSASNRVRRRVAQWLIVAEVACSVVLLIASGLLMRSFAGVLQVQPGFDAEHALIVRTTFNRQRYESAERRHQAERTILARLSELPGAVGVALTTHVPLADERQIGVAIEGHPPGEVYWADNALVSGGYFRIMGIPVLSGRDFSDADTPQSPLVAVVNQSMARRHWPNENSIGKRFQWGGRLLTIVGVVGDVHVKALDSASQPMVYSSVYQVESGATTNAVFVIRTDGKYDPMQLASAAQNVIWSVDGGLPIREVSSLDQVVSESLAIRRASFVFIAGFALLALALSAIGVYGVLSYAVTQRTQEMGLRLAIGATPVGVVRLVVAEGLKLAICGAAIGLIGGAVTGTFLSALLFRIGALDPITFAGAALLMIAVSLIACCVPARRAARVDPLVALRYE